MSNKIILSVKISPDIPQFCVWKFFQNRQKLNTTGKDRKGKNEVISESYNNSYTFTLVNKYQRSGFEFYVSVYVYDVQGNAIYRNVSWVSWGPGHNI